LARQNAQNLFGTSARWAQDNTLLMFDLNIVLGNGSWGGPNLFAINGADQGLANVFM